MKTIESNISSIKLQTSNSKDEMQTLRLINVYNPCSLSIIFTEESSTISHLNKLIKDDCEQLIVEDFNLHHSHWKDRRCFTRHTATDVLLDIVTNARLELLLEPGTITREAHNNRSSVWQRENTVHDTQMRDENWSASRIWSSFDRYEVMPTHILRAAHSSPAMKENKHRSTKRSFKNTSSRRSFSQRQDSDRWQSSWDHSCVTRSYREVYFLDKALESSTRLLKSELLESRDEIATATSRMENAGYSRDMKRLPEIQWSQKQGH